MTSLGYGGQSMTAPLRRVLLSSPRSAAWGAGTGWRELGYFHEPDLPRAEAQHSALVRLLQDAGVETLFLNEGDGLGLDGVYAHDASILTDGGAICLRMGKPARSSEPRFHRRFYGRLGIPILGELREPATAEAGDAVWLDAATLLVGRGYRTNAAGIEALSRLLAPRGVEVLEAHLPHGRGPGDCLHLMSLLSLLDEMTVLVDLPWLAVTTVEILRGRGFELVEIEPSERGSMAANVLALGGRRLIALEENRCTNRRLRERGFDVLTFEGSEICQNGSGGPTCLTRPLLRG